MNKSKKYKYFRKNRHNKHKTRKIQSGGLNFKIPSLKNPFSKSSPSAGTDSKPLLTPPQNQGEKKSLFSGFTRNKNPEGAEKKPQNEGEKKSWFTRKKKPEEAENKQQNEGEKKSWNPFTRKKKPVDSEIELQPMGSSLQTQPMGSSLQTQQMAMSQEHNTNPNKENTEPQKGHDPKHDNQKKESKGTHDNSGAGAGAGAGSEPLESTEQTPSDPTRNKKKEEKILAARTAALAQAEELEKTANTHTDPQIQNELRAKAARLRSIAQEHPDPDVVLIPKGAKNGLLGWFSSFFKKSQQNLPIEQALVAYTDQMPDIIEESNKNAKVINDVNKTLRYRLIELINKISRKHNTSNAMSQSGGSGEEEEDDFILNYITPEEKDEMDYLLERIRNNIKISNEVINDPARLANTQRTGNLAASDSMFAQPPPPPSKQPKQSKQSKQQPPSNPPPGQQPPGQQPPGQQPPGQLPPGAQQAAQQAAQQHAEQSKPPAGQQPPKPPGGPPNKPLPPPPPPSKQPKQSKQSKQQPPSNPPPGQQPPGQQPPGQQPPGQLPPGAQQAAQQAAQQHAEQSKPPAGQQPPKPPGGPPNKPLPPPPPPKPPGGPPNKPLPPPPPPKPPSMSKAPSMPKAPSVPITSSLLSSVKLNPLKVLKGGGDGNNKTRKNRQYIHEIKDNRTQLFNKEMEIINSIRNFKHGHGPNEHGKNKPENIQKKFIKVIKRS